MENTFVYDNNPNPNIEPNTTTATPKKSKRTLLIVIAASVVVLAIAVAAIIFFTKDKKDDQSSTNGSTSQSTENTKGEDQKAAAANAVTASSLSDFDAVCSNGTVKNAADSTGAKKIVAFSQNSGNRKDTWTSVSTAYSASYTADREAPQDVTTVACIKEKKNSAVKSSTCSFKVSGEEKTADYYAVEYDLTLLDAKTGKTVSTSSESIGGPATKCPMFASFTDKNDLKLYAKPDQASIDAALAAFAG